MWSKAFTLVQKTFKQSKNNIDFGVGNSDYVLFGTPEFLDFTTNHINQGMGDTFF